MRICRVVMLVLAAAGYIGGLAWADSGVASATHADQALAKYDVTGQGVIVAILDRGIDYTHPDFRNSDGTTRIKYMLDMSGQILCDPHNPQPVEYSAAQINQALKTNVALGERDAVGHGTVTAGLAAGNGRAVLPNSLQYAGLAPQADLLIVKVTSEGAPAHNGQLAEAPFQGCFDQALDWVVSKATVLHEPIAALINSGTQWGPIDGTSAVSRKIDADFGTARPGRVYVAASGDEGTLNNHSRGTYTNTTAATFDMNIAKTSYPAFMQVWYTGSAPADIKLTFNDDGTTLTVPPGGSGSKKGVMMYQYDPGQQFYPWQSSGPDRAAWIEISGHNGAATIEVKGTQAATGTVDVYGDAAPVITFTNDLTPGRLTDYSATKSAIVTGAYVVRTQWVDINGHSQTLANEGLTGQLWEFSSGGPTRDGRLPPHGGVDITTPGANCFGAYGLDTYWDTFSFNLIQGGKGYYGRQSATSGAAPLTLGAVALLLQMNPRLTQAQVKQILHSTAISDANTGATPNPNWGAGKLNVLAAANAVAAMIPAKPSLAVNNLTFNAQKVGTTSTPQAVMFSNKGTAALTITNIATAGDFHVTTTNCAKSLAASANCSIKVAFKPTAKGTRTGTLTIKDFNISSPQTVNLKGTGT